ncbi:class I glutamine amidotransferase-like protein [Diaporthe sp. PMI_573]|nr:class I glutamine amidotransferase-like protein [Diaporthaceae sp. PMI_573]
MELFPILATLMTLIPFTVYADVTKPGIHATGPIDVTLSDNVLNLVNQTLPNKFGIVLFPTFQALDVFGPLDILNMLSLWHPMNLSIIAHTLDPVSTAFNQSLNVVGSSFHETVVPTHTFANPPTDLDVLIVPGGWGASAPGPGVEAAVNFIRDTYPRLKHIISVCTGAGLLARAGILDGRKATTNKRAWHMVVGMGPKTHWIGHARWVVDGNIYTTSGVSAGIDGTLAYVEDVFGSARAEDLALEIEHVRVLDSTSDPFADAWNVTDVLPVL